MARGVYYTCKIIHFLNVLFFNAIFLLRLNMENSEVQASQDEKK